MSHGMAGSQADAAGPAVTGTIVHSFIASANTVGEPVVLQGSVSTWEKVPSSGTGFIEIPHDQTILGVSS